MPKDFSNVNVRLVGSGGIDNVVDKAKDKLKGFGEGFGNTLEEAKGLFAGDGGDGTGAALGNIAKIAGFATGLAGPFGLAAVAVGTVVTGAKSAYDWYKEYRKEQTEAAAAKATEARESRLAPLRRLSAEQSAAMQGVNALNKSLLRQVEVAGKAGDEASIYAAKLALVNAKLVSKSMAFDPLSTMTPMQRFVRQNNDMLRALDQAELVSKMLADRKKASQIKADSESPTARFASDLAETTRLSRFGLITRGEYGRKVGKMLDDLEKIAPDPRGLLASSTTAGSADAASFVLRSQAASQAASRPAADRLKEAFDRAAQLEEQQLKVQEEMLKALDEGLRFTASF